MRHHVRDEALFAVVAQVGWHCRHHIRDELILPDGNHRRLHIRVREHRGLNLPELHTCAADLDHAVPSSDDLQAAAISPNSKVARARGTSTSERLDARQEGLGCLVGQVHVSGAQAGAGDADLADGVRADGRVALVHDRAALPRVGAACAHEASLRGKLVDVLHRAHLDGCDVALLCAAVAGVQQTVLGQGGKRTKAEFGRNGRTPDADIRHGSGQAVLQQDVEHCRNEACTCCSVRVGEGPQVCWLDDVRIPLGQVQAATAVEEGSEQVVNERHPRR
mmetsp:Transcript_119444/g.381022  ORF Transcript_119444/g.381022 Transcript_119444/m.381022 type:complete len:278 (-) Transcript_119444:1527-2360(-)